MRKGNIFSMKWLIKLVLMTSVYAEETWYGGKLEGWYYFQEQEEKVATAPEEAHALLEEEKRKVQEDLSLALLQPTKEHVQIYVEGEKKMREKSAAFAEVWGEIEDDA